MPYKATVFNVMIASPSDVETERKLARDAINEWNALHSEDKGIVLLPVAWDTHTSPEMGANPQTIIDKQILGKADLLIGIFLHRLGTPTLDAQSGTAHEIDSHVDVSKPAMIYFLEEKVDPSTFDRKQYNKLIAFKDDLRTKGLLHECKRDEFRDNCLRHLTLTVNQHEYFEKEKIEIQLPNFADWADTDETTLTDEAKALLLEAVSDTEGRVTLSRTFSGTSIRTNRRELIPDQKARTIAEWTGVLDELTDNEFLKDRGHKGEVFGVTKKGYKYADKLKNEATASQDISAGTPASSQREDLEFDQRKGIYISKKDRSGYCPKCLDSTPSNRVPLKEDESCWHCHVCDKYYSNPDYNPPRQARRNPME